MNLPLMRCTGSYGCGTLLLCFIEITGHDEEGQAGSSFLRVYLMPEVTGIAQ